MSGLPLALIYSSRAVRRAPDRRQAAAAVILSTLSVAGLGVAIAVNALLR